MCRNCVMTVLQTFSFFTERGGEGSPLRTREKERNRKNCYRTDEIELLLK